MEITTARQNRFASAIAALLQWIHPGRSPAYASLRGRATVAIAIPAQGTGRVKFQGSWWPARSATGEAIAAGETVYPIGRHNITLIVQSMESVDR